MPSRSPVALVTGANRGIGFALARELGRRGLRVIAGARRASEGAEAAAALRSAGADATCVVLDVADDASTAEAAEAVARTTTALDVLVNNAAVLLDPEDDVLRLDAPRLLKTLDVNVVGVWRVTRALWPLLAAAAKERGEARVVNVSSAAGEIEPASGWAPAYAVSKAALNALTVKLALAGKPAKVSVNAACPGWVRTAMGGPDAPKAPEQAAEDLAWLALDAPASLAGVFVRDRTVVPW